MAVKIKTPRGDDVEIVKIRKDRLMNLSGFHNWIVIYYRANITGKVKTYRTNTSLDDRSWGIEYRDDDQRRKLHLADNWKDVMNSIAYDIKNRKGRKGKLAEELIDSFDRGTFRLEWRDDR